MALFGRENEQDKARAEAWAAWLNRQNPFAIASAVLGVFSLIEFGVLGIFGVAGVVTGWIALRQLRRVDASTQRNAGHRLAWIGIATSVISLVLAAVIYFGRFGHRSA
jgi:hypothetical protein